MPSMSNINTNRGNSNTINTTCGNTSESNAPESMIPLESIIKNSLGQFQHQITFKTVLIQACRFWELYYSKYLQYMEAVFLPVQMEFRNALINKFGFLVDVIDSNASIGFPFKRNQQ
ncbi:hypothetical protein AX774_g1504 [Zancudomyces culisetae]|uniref:Uncharacterized protein n=1 Tax=Zancudomyces culisetae TaxID=1213189 RepID=A0A1R1PVG9_ZANCU|nr:hypothetical protein AX774_g1504 [Zancudomyces culisetae]|eukprot:OMH84953.1 hypothetical protein AX774_g1504 [Zancudomyces culisetae]